MVLIYIVNINSNSVATFMSQVKTARLTIDEIDNLLALSLTVGSIFFLILENYRNLLLLKN